MSVQNNLQSQYVLWFPNLQNLDLGENLFNSWTMLAEIGRQLKNLKVFAVSDNRLVLPPNPG